MRTKTARMVALGLLLTACSGGAAEPTTTTTTTLPPTTTVPPTTTTTTTLDLDLSPVTGLPLDDPELGERRVLAVKIDNHPRAVPQSGIDQADLVIEILVEGVTRWLTLWQESDSEYLGPMRSGRPTDSIILAGLNTPTFARSGAQQWVQAVAALKDIHQIGEIGPPSTFRLSGRSAPHNLYVNTVELRNVADSRGHSDEAPPPLWSFGPMPGGADAASLVSVRFNGNVVTWEWDSVTGEWLRSAYARESMFRDQDGSEGRISVPVLIALHVEQYVEHPPPGWTGQSLPSSRTIGSGKAQVFADGKVIEGTWERPEESEWFTLTYENGETIQVPPGRSWVSLVPNTGGLTYEP
jgi:hypothetical protein